MNRFVRRLARICGVLDGLCLVLLSAVPSAAQAVVFWPSPVPLVEGVLERRSPDCLTLAITPGVYISLQPDGRIETRTVVGSWECASRIGASVLRFDGAGTPRFLFLQSRDPIGTPGIIPEPNAHHVGPGPLTVARAQQVVHATAAEFPHLLGPQGTDGEAYSANVELLRRVIWHLRLAGFEAARQRNPSGLISADKLCVRLEGAWQAIDIGTLGSAGRAMVIVVQLIGGADPLPDLGLPDPPS